MSRVLLCTFAAALLLASTAWGQATLLETEWVRQFGGNGPVSVVAQATDSNGNVYIAGLTGGTFVSADGIALDNAGGLDAFVRKYNTAGQEIWTRQFGGLPDDEAMGIAVDSDGVYVVGLAGGAITGQVSAGAIDAFIRKYDTNGNEIWTRQFGSAVDDQAKSISISASGIYVTGLTFGTLPGQTAPGLQDAFVRKYDRDGLEVWTRQFGTANADQGTSIVADASGVYVAGITSGALPGQTFLGSFDAFVRKYTEDGDVVWTREFGTTAAEQALGISSDTTGIYVVGFTTGVLQAPAVGGIDAFVRKYNSDGVVQWTRQFGASGIPVSADSATSVSADATGVYVAGSTSGPLASPSFGGQDAFVRKYDANGTVLWTSQLGSNLSDSALGVSVDSTAVYVVGQTAGALPGLTKTGTTDAFIRKYDLVGAAAWTLQFGTIGPTSDAAQATDAHGNVYITGQTNGALPDEISLGLNDVFLRKYDADGSELWTRQFGSVGDDQAKGTVIDGANVYVTGWTSGTLPGQTFKGAIDSFLRKYDEDGNEVWTRQFGTNVLDQAESIAIDATGIYIAGTVTQMPFGAPFTSDAFVYKYDRDGNQLWVRQIATSGGDRALGVAANASGVYVAGFTDGTFPGQTNFGGADAFIRKYDSNGIEVWTRQFGTAGSNQALSIAVTETAGLFVGGSNSTPPGVVPDTNAFVARFDIDGNALWSRELATQGSDLTLAVRANATGVYAAGTFNGSFLGVYSGNFEGFVRKYDVEGNLLWDQQFISEASDRVTGIAVDSDALYVVGVTDNFPDAFVVKLLEFVPVSIDIRPGTPYNPINLGSNGVVPVAILSSPTFDARNVDPLSVVLAGATIKLKGNGQPLFSLQDINQDGRVDMLIQVNTNALELSDDDVQAILTGRLSDGQRIKGMDSVRVVP